MRFLPFLCLLLLGCSPRLAEGTYLIEPGEDILLAAGERLKPDRKSDDLFTFLEVVEDSRCPIDVQCIQAGRAVVRVRVLRDGQPIEEEVTVDGEAIETDRGPLRLLGLDPYPESSVDRPQPYRLTLRLLE